MSIAWHPIFFFALVVSTPFIFNHICLIKYFKSSIIYFTVISEILCSLWLVLSEGYVDTRASFVGLLKIKSMWSTLLVHGYFIKKKTIICSVMKLDSDTNVWNLNRDQIYGKNIQCVIHRQEEIYSKKGGLAT